MGDSSAMSLGQKSLWLLHQMAPASSAYNIAFGLRIRGPLDLAALGSAVDVLLERHPILRSCFPMVGDDPVRAPAARDLRQYFVHDATGLDDHDAHHLAERLSREPFDVEAGPVFRVLVLRLAASDAVLVLNAHHIASDAISQGLAMDELLQLYAGQAPPAGTATEAFDDYVDRERRILDSSRRVELETYWSQACAGAPLVLELPRDRPRPPTQSFSGATCELNVDPRQASQLRHGAAAIGVTPFIHLLSVFQILLSRYTSAEDFLLACPVSTRFNSRTMHAIGYLVNTVCFRATPRAHQSMREVAAHTATTFMDGMRHVDLPLSETLRLLDVPRDPSRPAGCQIAFTMVVADPRRPLLELIAKGESGGGTLPIGPLTLHPFDIDQQEGQFDLAVEALMSSTSLRLLFRYDTSLFDTEFVEQLMRHFRRLLDAVLADPDLPVGRIGLLDEAEIARMLALGRTDASAQPRIGRTMVGTR